MEANIPDKIMEYKFEDQDMEYEQEHKEHPIKSSIYKNYVENALEAVKIKFSNFVFNCLFLILVDSMDNLGIAENYKVEFVHQHFGQE